MVREIKVRTEADITICQNVIADEFARHGERLVRIISLDESFTERQRGLYWRWCEAIAGKTGETKIDVHERLKERYLINIYLADPDNHQDIVSVVEPMRIIRNQAPAMYGPIRDYVMRSISHLAATKKNMTEYLQCIESDAISQQIALPYPPEKENLLGR